MKLNELKQIIRKEIIKELNELEFSSQDEFDKYKSKHDLKKSTKVKIGDLLKNASNSTKYKGEDEFKKIYDKDKSFTGNDWEEYGKEYDKFAKDNKLSDDEIRKLTSKWSEESKKKRRSKLSSDEKTYEDKVLAHQSMQKFNPESEAKWAKKAGLNKAQFTKLFSKYHPEYKNWSEKVANKVYGK